MMDVILSVPKDSTSLAKKFKQNISSKIKLLEY